MKYYKEKGQSSEDKDEDTHRIGPFVFQKPVTKSLKEKVKFLYRNITNNHMINLRLEKGRFQEVIPGEMLAMASKYEIQSLEELHLKNNKIEKPNFLCKMHFPNLMILDLSCNNLFSMSQLFKSMNFPLLQCLILCNNHFTSLRGFKKWVLPHLIKLSLELNYLIDISELFQAQLPALEQLELYGNNIGDFKSLIKADIPKLQSLELYDNSFDVHHCLSNRVLHQKFTHIGQG